MSDTSLIELTTRLPKQVVDLDNLEVVMMGYEQTDCPVSHSFIRDFYVRTVMIPAGVFAMGHTQKFFHINRVIAGKVEIFDNGESKIIEAPCTFIGSPGRKVGFIHEDTIWQNWYPNHTGETDPEVLEEMYLSKSDKSKEAIYQKLQYDYTTKEAERDDYKLFLAEIGYTDEDVIREMDEAASSYLSEYKDPDAFFRITNSPIHGLGVFLEAPAYEGEKIGISKLRDKKTPLGRYLNHSGTPNAKFVLMSDGNIWVVATKYIAGRKAGFEGDEVVVDYRDAVSVITEIEFSKETSECLE